MTERTITIEDDEYEELEVERDELLAQNESFRDTIGHLEADIEEWETAWNDSEQLLIRIGELTDA